MLNILAIGGLALSLAAAPLITESTNPPSEKITLQVVTVNGSGCPAGTAAVAASPDNTSFTVTYSNYLAQVGVGAKPTDFRKNCQLNVAIKIPGGFSYAIAQADYRGFGYLEDGARALQQASYYYTGQSATASLSTDFYGPFDDNWQVTDVAEVAELNWSPCGVTRNVNINSELRVYAGSSDKNKTTSFFAMDSTDGNINTEFHLAWKKC
jgi:hypothetical protein